MVMPPCGTFDYVVVVPTGAAVHADGSAGPWATRMREPVARTGEELHDNRLVGHAPQLRIADAAPAPPDAELAAPAPPGRPFARPRVARSRLTLSAATRRNAQVRAAHLHVARALPAVLRPGDVLHLARTACAGLGLSILRGGRLVVAVGAVSEVPLGDGVSVHFLPRRALEFFGRFATAEDEAAVPGFGDSHWDQPVELRVGADAQVLELGHTVLGGYAVYLGHGHQPGVPGTDECVALAHPDACPPEVAVASAQLLALDEFLMDRW